MRLIVPCLFAVYADGGICLDILQNQWSPIYDVSAILTSIQVGLQCNATKLVRLAVLLGVAPLSIQVGLCQSDYCFSCDPCDQWDSRRHYHVGTPCSTAGCTATVTSVSCAL